MSNIVELNEKLYKLMDGLETGKVDSKTAQAMINVSTAIAANTKILLDAAKFAKNPNISNMMIGEENAKRLAYKDGYDERLNFAIEMGYDNIAEAIAGMGKANFEQKLKSRSL